MRTDFTAEEQSLQETEIRRNNSGDKLPDNRQAPENVLPKDKRKALKQIIADKATPFHVRSEAIHIIELGDRLGVAEFNYRFDEFVQSYNPVTPGDVTGQPLPFSG